MTAKMVIVLAFLPSPRCSWVSGRNVGEVFSGFFRVGSAPLRAATVIADGHFTLSTREAGVAYTIRGTMENGRPVPLSFAVDREGNLQTFGIGDPIPPGLENRRRRMLEQAGRLARKEGFYIEVVEGAAVLSAEGSIAEDRFLASRRLLCEAERTGGTLREPGRSFLRPLPAAWASWWTARAWSW